MPDLDLDLLRSFVSVVDTGGFTRAGERVHRTQSTVSQQIRRLEEMLGLSAAACGTASKPRRPRKASGCFPMRGGFWRSPRRRATWWRGRSVTAWCGSVFRRISPPIGSPSSCPTSSAHVPALRLDVRCGLSVQLRGALERGELDLALLKREAGEGDGDRGMAGALALDHQPTSIRSISFAIRCRWRWRSRAASIAIA